MGARHAHDEVLAEQEPRKTDEGREQSLGEGVDLVEQREEIVQSHGARTGHGPEVGRERDETQRSHDAADDNDQLEGAEREQEEQVEQITPDGDIASARPGTTQQRCRGKRAIR